MNKKLSISMAVILLSGMALITNDVSAGDSSQSSDPNVLALKAARNAPRCYLNDNFSCQNIKTDDPCALCDDEVIIRPPQSGGSDDGPTTPPSN